MLLWAFAFQLEEQGYYYELEGNWVNICCICEALSRLINLRITRKDRFSVNPLTHFWLLKNILVRMYSFEDAQLL